MEAFIIIFLLSMAIQLEICVRAFIFWLAFSKAAFLIQIFLHRQKIADVNGDIFRSCRQMCKSRRQIYFSLIAHYQLTSL